MTRELDLDDHPLTSDQVAFLHEQAEATRQRWVAHRALERYPWCFPPESDKEDRRRAKEGKPKRDWTLTREMALSAAARSDIK
jgi:hypothetical protein